MTLQFGVIALLHLLYDTGTWGHCPVTPFIMILELGVIALLHLFFMILELGGHCPFTLSQSEENCEFQTCERKSTNYSPHIKQVFLRISSFCCFSLLKSANVSMMTPKIRLRMIIMTMKKNKRS